MDTGETRSGSDISNVISTQSLPSDASTVTISSPTSTLNVDFDEITLEEKVGHGSYGVVYKGSWRKLSVAVKEFGANAEPKAFDTEVKQLTRVCHPNIIALYGISCKQSFKYLIMEYAEGGSLHIFLHGKVQPVYTMAHAMSWARQCAEGVAYLHAMKPKPLIHRDLKPLNLLLTNKGRQLKICDFGTVADKSTMMTNSRGSAAWMAPEVFAGSKYTEKCDLFSWAIVLWEVLSRKQPFKEIDNTLSIMWKIHKGERPPKLPKCPERIEKLMFSCWETAPDLRPSMSHVVSEMNEIVKVYPGADQPIEYEFVNQQIITKDTSATNSLYALESSATSTQVTPTNGPAINTNTSDATTPTNSTEHVLGSSCASSTEDSDVIQNSAIHKPTASVINNAYYSQYSVIPEEESEVPTDTENFNMTPSADAAKRYESMRNKMIASKPMTPLTLDVDEYESNHSECNSISAKNDGKERYTVADTKPILMPTPPTLPSNTMTDMTNNNNKNISSSNQNNNNNRKNNQSVDCRDSKSNRNVLEQTETEQDAESCDSDNVDNDTDQSLIDILDPELRPEPPIPDDAESLAIYCDHHRLVKEYFRVDTRLYYAQDFKDKLTMEMDQNKLQPIKIYLDKINESEQLATIYKNLKKQLENLKADNRVDGVGSTAAVPTTGSGGTTTDGGGGFIGGIENTPASTATASETSSNNSLNGETVSDEWELVP